MNDRVYWIEHKSKKIFFMDYSKLDSTIPDQENEVLEIINKCSELLTKHSEKILFLSDASGSTPSIKVISAFKKLAADLKNRDLIQKDCVVGINAMGKALLSGINFSAHTKIKVFETVNQAKDWLVS